MRTAYPVFSPKGKVEITNDVNESEIKSVCDSSSKIANFIATLNSKSRTVCVSPPFFDREGLLSQRASQRSRNNGGSGISCSFSFDPQSRENKKYFDHSNKSR